MAFHSFHDFILMGKHGIYVWSAYALALIGIIGVHVYAALRRRRLQNTLDILKKDDETR